MKTACELDIVIGVDLECGEVDADGCGVADGRGAAHLEITDCCPDLALCFEMEIFSFVWEFGLVDDNESTLLVVEGECFHVEDAGGHCVPLFLYNRSWRPSICMERPYRLALLATSPVPTGEADVRDMKMHYTLGYLHFANSSAGMVAGSCPRTVRQR